MSTSQRFEIEEPVLEQPSKARGCGSSCLKGCLVTSVVLLVLAAIAGWWLYNHGRAWLSQFGADALKETINASELPPAEKDQIAVQIDRLAVEFREGRMTAKQLETIVNGFVQSPLMTSLAVSALEKQYVDASGLTDDEKAEGRTTLRRFMRGSVDGAINQQARDAAMAHVAVRGDDGNWELREQLTDDQLRAFFKEAKAQADKANVAPGPEDFDPSDEFQRVIDRAMNGAAAEGPPAAEPADGADPPAEVAPPAAAEPAAAGDGTK